MHCQVHRYTAILDDLRLILRDRRAADPLGIKLAKLGTRLVNLIRGLVSCGPGLGWAGLGGVIEVFVNG